MLMGDTQLMGNTEHTEAGEPWPWQGAYILRGALCLRTGPPRKSALWFDLETPFVAEQGELHAPCYKYSKPLLPTSCVCVNINLRLSPLRAA